MALGVVEEVADDLGRREGRALRSESAGHLGPDVHTLREVAGDDREDGRCDPEPTARAIVPDPTQQLLKTCDLGAIAFASACWSPASRRRSRRSSRGRASTARAGRQVVIELGAGRPLGLQNLVSEKPVDLGPGAGVLAPETSRVHRAHDESAQRGPQRQDQMGPARVTVRDVGQGRGQRRPVHTR